MGTRSWSSSKAAERIRERIAALQLKDIEIRDYVRAVSLEDLPNRIAYRVDAVHLYVDILNLADILNLTGYEGETCHRKTLRFLNLHYRAVSRILERTEANLVDFHNQRLHSVMAKPYGSEAMRIQKAVAVAQLIIDVLERTGEDADHPAAKVRVGIDSGKALAVNNGRRGHREPLFLGVPANHAAKRAGGGTQPGLYVTNEVRKVLGLAEVPNEDAAALSRDVIQACRDKADLEITADQIVKEWRQDLDNNPIGSFDFSAHTPPYRNLDMETLSARNSRRQEAAALYADLDGFTEYVANRIDNDESAKQVVQALHVLRSELDAVLYEDFEGQKVRFIGDCIHGLLVEGTAQTTDVEGTISTLALCSGAMRSSFNLVLTKLQEQGSDASGLGLAIGFEQGSIPVTRLGIKGGLIRCSVSRAVLRAEEEQARCGGTETAIGREAYKQASAAVRDLFGPNRKRSGLDYPTCLEELAGKSDKTAAAAKLALRSLLRPATAAPYSFPPRRTGPVKPNGFA